MNPAKDGSFEEDLLFVDSSSMYLACIFGYLTFSIFLLHQQHKQNINTKIP